MTNYLLTGGGTAGHVNPLLTIADHLRKRSPQDQVLALGTKEGLESRLVPEAGIESIRSKLTLKIFDEYTNILKGMYITFSHNIPPSQKPSGMARFMILLLAIGISMPEHNV